MDEDAALTTAAGTGLVPEVRAELQSLAQGARETIGRAWSSPHPPGPMLGPGAGSGSGPRPVGWNPCRLPRQPSRPHGPL